MAYREYELSFGPECIVMQSGSKIVPTDGESIANGGREVLTVSRFGEQGDVLPGSVVMQKVCAWLTERNEEIVFAYEPVEALDPHTGINMDDRHIVVTRVLSKEG